MGNCLRTCVSLQKRRTVIGAGQVDEATGLKSAAGVDLDLTMVHPRIVAMGFPAVGLDACYRNPRDDVVAFVRENFGSNFRVYNLCSEPDRQYDPAVFSALAYQRVQWPDHLPPTLRMLRTLIADACAFLESDAANLVLVHCKAGKGRTGTVICCLLLAIGAAADAERAIAMFGDARTKDSKGLTIPSQRRYVAYFAEVLWAARAAARGATATATAARIPRDPTSGAGFAENDAVALQQRGVTVARVRCLRFPFAHVVRRDPSSGAPVDHYTLALVRDGDGEWFESPPGAPGNATALSDDFIVCLSDSPQFPCKHVSLWLHAAFVVASTTPASPVATAFTVQELDGGRPTFGASASDRQALIVWFARSS
jgi:hypothetical protein